MAGIDGLVQALQQRVLNLEDDLRSRVDGPDPDTRQAGVEASWRGQYQAAFAARRTAAAWETWRDERITQAAVAWVLLTVFARYSEDNKLVSTAWIAGPDADARQQALDARRAFANADITRTNREWLQEISGHFEKFEATRGLVDQYSPLHLVSPSADGARELLEFWWDADESGELRWTFPDVETRFLGDLYQDLSEYAKKTYALLQTPEFVEEFILDRTMTPALKERPLEGFTLIDPTCGSGHFLLGAFQRLLAAWENEAPGAAPREWVARALRGVYGVDINPFAVAIARFRLLVAAMKASGDSSIETAIDFELNLATGDSLLWGARQQALDDDLLTLQQGQYSDTTENVELLKGILQREHDAVVGNPPYVSVKDPALRELYKGHYPKVCHGKWVLTVPFMELFFELAHNGTNHSKAGWVGQITGNNFMKREFGVKLIESFLTTVDLREVIDSSGAYIPGHGTPTVILIGRNRIQVSDTIRTVLGIRGEPGRPDCPENGIVWSSITERIDEPGFDNTWINVVDMHHSTLRTHPWSLSGGGAPELTSAIDRVTNQTLGKVTTSVGITSFTLEDDVFIQPIGVMKRKGIPVDLIREMVAGDEVRDWRQSLHDCTIFPYDSNFTTTGIDAPSSTYRFMWPFRCGLENNKMFGNKTKVEAGLKWYEFGRLTAKKLRIPLSITFAEVASHNHFVLDRGGKVFKQTAPVIKLPEGSSDDDHLKLVGVLNSSVACFWLKQNCHQKGGGLQSGGGEADQPFTWSYAFNATTLKDFPLPSTFPLDAAKKLDNLACSLSDSSPVATVHNTTPTLNILNSARLKCEHIQALMISQQEELDWEIYNLYGLIDVDLTYSGELPEVALGERAFEIALARNMEGGEETSWFEHHRSSPTPTIPMHLPTAYRDLIQRRIDAIESNPKIRLLEKPEHKRRWSTVPWDKQVAAALRDWLLVRVEDESLWFDRDCRPTPRSVAQLSDILDRDEEFRQVLHLWTGHQESSTGTALKQLLAEEAVPYLAAYRYKESGLRKRRAWESTWDLQRREDRGEISAGPIPVPPKYTSADFMKPSYSARRGKLDVPKERFISYPHANQPTDPTELLGWAGWDHGQQALALAGILDTRIQEEAPPETLVPLVAGLAELMPWVEQWHGEVIPEYGESLAKIIEEELRIGATAIGMTPEEARAWRPATKVRKTRAKKETE